MAKIGMLNPEAGVPPVALNKPRDYNRDNDASYSVTDRLSHRTQVKNDGMSLDAAVSGSLRDQWNQYLENADPLMQGMLDDLDSRDLVNQARADSQYLPSQIKTAQNIRQRRGGVIQSADQRRSGNRIAEFSAALGQSDAINNARVNQRELNTGKARMLTNHATQLRKMGIGAMTDAYGMQAGRNARNAQRRAQARMGNFNGLMSMFATGASMGMGG